MEYASASETSFIACTKGFNTLIIISMDVWVPEKSNNVKCEMLI